MVFTWTPPASRASGRTLPSHPPEPEPEPGPGPGPTPAHRRIRTAGSSSGSSSVPGEIAVLAPPPAGDPPHLPLARPRSAPPMSTPERAARRPFTPPPPGAHPAPVADRMRSPSTRLPLGSTPSPAVGHPPADPPPVRRVEGEVDRRSPPVYGSPSARTRLGKQKHSSEVLSTAS